LPVCAVDALFHGFVWSHNAWLAHKVVETNVKNLVNNRIERDRGIQTSQDQKRKKRTQSDAQIITCSKRIVVHTWKNPQIRTCQRGEQTVCVSEIDTREFRPEKCYSFLAISVSWKMQLMDGETLPSKMQQQTGKFGPILMEMFHMTI
jgi:hypothetical protein